MTDEECRRWIEEKFGDRIRADVDKWPPLTQEQRDRLAVILRPVGGQEGVTPIQEQ